MVLEDAKFQDQDFDSNVNRSWGTEINIEGTSYATSLFWQPLQNKDDPYAEVEEASAGVLEGADLFCIKPGKAPQFGICVGNTGCGGFSGYSIKRPLFFRRRIQSQKRLVVHLRP